MFQKDDTAWTERGKEGMTAQEVTSERQHDARGMKRDDTGSDVRKTTLRGRKWGEKGWRHRK